MYQRGKLFFVFNVELSVLLNGRRRVEFGDRVGKTVNMSGGRKWPFMAVSEEL